jgi:hypothetical protein
MDTLNIVIKDYLSAAKTDYAIMISGEWGCGKSYYLHHEFEELIKTITVPQQTASDEKKVLWGKDSKPVKLYSAAHISLYGVSSPEDFEYRVFCGINKWAENRLVRVVGLIGEKIAGSKGISGSKNDIKTLTIIGEDRVLVFDDLERICEDRITVKEVLGLINTYAEHLNRKVIIVCNEKEYLSDDTDKNVRDDYKKYKEKSVRFTYFFTPDEEAAYDAMTKGVPEGAYKCYLKDNKYAILAVFRVGGSINLRTLKFFIDTFGKIYDEANKSKHAPRIINNYMIAHMLYAKEHKKGVTIDELCSLDDSQFIIDENAIFGIQGKEEPEKKKDYGAEFRETYSTVYSDFVNSKALLEYISSGSINRSNLLKEFHGLEIKYDKEQGTEEGRVYNKLNNTAQLKDEEIQPLLEKLIGFIKSDKYNLYDLLYIYTLFLKYNYWHIGGFEITKEIDELVLSSMERQKEKHIYNSMFEYKTPIWDSSAESKKEHDMYNAIKSVASRINREARVANEATECNQFIAVVEGGDVNELRKYRMDGNNRMSVNGMDWNRIGNLILTAPNPIACELCDCIIFLTPDAALVSVTEQERIREKLIPVLDAFMTKRNGELRVINVTYLLKHLKEVTGMISRYQV